MAGKKEPGRFTISLNLEDPIQREVADAINRQGQRRKAQFIVNAISHYIHCTESPAIPCDNAAMAADAIGIEAVIRKILSEQGLIGEENHLTPAIQVEIPTEQETEIRRRTEEVIGEKGLTAMKNSLAAFRRR